MSHAHGTVEFEDGIIMHYEFDGTSDIAISYLYDTKEEVSENWRSFKRASCQCGNDEPITIKADYAEGLEWNSRACRKCKSIIGKLNRYDGDCDQDFGFGISE